MMIQKISISIIIATLLNSCNPQLKISDGTIGDSNVFASSKVFVFGSEEEFPDGARYIDKIETEGDFFSTMEVRVNESIEILKTGAANLNGNAIVIQEIAFPGPFKSKSYDIKALVYQIEDLPSKSYKLVNKTSANKKYIMLFRNKKTFGSGLSFPIYLDKQYVIGLDNDRKVAIELDDTRERHVLEIESYGELHDFQILFNEESTIYIECGISKDGRPKVKFLDKAEGEKKFNKVKYAP